MKLLDRDGLSRFLNKIKTIIPTKTSDLTNDSGFLTQHNPVDSALSTTSENAVQNKVVKDALDGKSDTGHTHSNSDITSLDASKITTGTIDIARLPKGALERLVTVANQTARFALTTSDVQLGDTVKQLDTGVMYIVTDETKLSSADGYTEYTAGSATSVPWSGVTGKPSSFTPSSHTHGNVTNDGKLPTASRALISDSSKNITVSSVTDTELGYLSGVTSSVQTQLNGKAASNHVHGNITNDGKLGTTANKPLITGTGGVVQAGSFGNSANTFCEGNDSRLSDARTPVAHTHLTADVTDLLSNTHTWTSQQSYNSDLNLNYASTDVDDIVNSVAGSATLDNFVHMTGNETVNGIKSFPDGVIANVTGSATSATNDGSGNVISSTYGKLGANNTWSGYNIYTYDLSLKQTNLEKGELPASTRTKRYNFTDKNNASLGWLQHRVNTSGDSYLECFVANKFSGGQLSTQGSEIFNSIALGLHSDGSRYLNVLGDVYPDLPTRVCNLGTSTNKWENVYANKYFATMEGADNYGTYRILRLISSSGYGVFQRNDGVNWYLMVTDNNNALGTWSTARKYFPIQVQLNSGRTYINGEIRTAIDSYTEGTAPQSDIFNSFVTLQDSNGSLISAFQSAVRTDEYVDSTFWLCRNNISKGFMVRLSSDGATSSVAPTSDSATDLGTTDIKWKSFNGVNPGALSLPSENYSTANLDPTNWNTSGSANTYTAPSDGWLGVQVQSADILDLSGQYVFVGRTGGGGNFYPQSALSHIVGDWLSDKLIGCVIIPVISGKTYDIRIKIGKTQQEGSIIYARFYTCIGNV